jgi:hypothetical protein
MEKHIKQIYKKNYNYMNSLKEQSIRNYLAKINWRDNWNYNVIEEDMRKFLGERPCLDVTYKKDVMVNEVSGESREFTKLSKVSVVFIDTDDRPKKIEILID